MNKCRNCGREITFTVDGLQYNRGKWKESGRWFHMNGLSTSCWLSRELRHEVAEPMTEADVIDQVLTKYL